MGHGRRDQTSASWGSATMPAAQRTIMINRPPDQVFAFFAAPANDLRWRSAVQRSLDGEIASLDKPKPSSSTPGISRRSVGSHEDAEGMSRRVGVDNQGLVRIVGSVEEQASSKIERTLMLDVQLTEGGHCCVEVQHLGPRTLRPGWLRQMRYLLERQLRRTIGIAERQPILTIGVRRAGGGRFVARAVVEAEQLAIELGQRAGVFAVQYDLAKSRCCRLSGVAHLSMLADDGVPASPRVSLERLRGSQRGAASFPVRSAIAEHRLRRRSDFPMGVPRGKFCVSPNTPPPYTPATLRVDDQDWGDTPPDLARRADRRHAARPAGSCPCGARSQLRCGADRGPRRALATRTQLTHRWH